MAWATTRPRLYRKPDPVARRWHHILLVSAATVLLGGCDALMFGPSPPDTKPQARPPQVAAPPPEPAYEPSDASRALSAYYTRVQEELLTQGLLRTDGGGPDTPFTDTILARNFERIALAEEYKRGAGLQPSDGRLGRIKKWQGPVRIGAVFGNRVPQDVQRKDRAQLGAYARKLARVSGHAISYSEATPNFHVLVMGADDKDQLRAELNRIAPGMEPSSMAIFTNLPRSIHCLVVAFADSPTGNAYKLAVALVRSEHPDLMRRACYHEELAQGLGLANDDQNARPSIFNDDEEFALLTTHDELLLKILYDPRLTPGMTANQARPIVTERAAVLTGGAGPS